MNCKFIIISNCLKKISDIASELREFAPIWLVEDYVDCLDPHIKEIQKQINAIRSQLKSMNINC